MVLLLPLKEFQNKVLGEYLVLKIGAPVNATDWQDI
jgi:hypothetical protein